MASVLLLGAASDIAIAIARKFAQDKYNIILAGRDLEVLNDLKSDIQIRYQVKADVVSFDATNLSEHVSFYKNLAQKPEITVCVFGYLGEQNTAIADWKEAEKIVQTNYVGAMSILNIVAEDYRAAGKGTIVGISSVAGERGRQSNFIYGSAKAGFTAYLSGLRNYLYHHGVHVVTVLPGFVYTKMTANLKLSPLLTAKPEDVGEVVKNAVKNKKNIVYVKWFWRWIMLVIKLIPEGIFKKMQL